MPVPGESYFVVTPAEFAMIQQVDPNIVGIPVGNYVYILASSFNPDDFGGIGSGGFLIYMKSTQRAG